MNTPACPRHDVRMVARRGVDELHAWCGEWFDCPYPGCHNTVVIPSEALKAYLAEQAKAVQA